MLTIDTDLQKSGVGLHIGLLRYIIDNNIATPPGWEETLRGAEHHRRQDLMGEAPSSDPIIAQIRAAFKQWGKDPSRYRPSSEALTRRITTGDSLPSINMAVDCGNLASLMTGLPVGLYDEDKTVGNLHLRLGKAGETIDGVGNIAVNAENLLILCDEAGPIGSPYRDSLRTAVTPQTRHLLFVIYGLNLSDNFVEATSETADLLLTRFCKAEAVELT